MHPYSELETVFARKGHRLTAPRKAVFNALHHAGQPLMTKEIIAACPSIDRVSIYRTLELFTALDITEIVPLGWKQRYELTSPFKPHHHHLYCVTCGKLIDVHSQKLELLVAAIARQYDFSPLEHKFEVSGTCSDCHKKHPS